LPSGLPIAIRKAEESDLSFVIASWSDSLLGHSPEIRAWLGKEDTELSRELARGYRRKIAAVLPESETWVTSHRSEPAILYGFVVTGRGRTTTEKIVHYLFVKESFRHLGLARGLLEAAGAGSSSSIITTHWTRACEAYDDHRPGFLLYRPSLFRACHWRRHHETDSAQRSEIA